MDDLFTVPCPRCSTPVTLCWDAGVPMSRWDPGEPPSWYPPDPDQCPHLDDLTDAEWQTMQAQAEAQAPY